jgi:uncharacterized protein (TIGR02145 family)
MNVESLVIETEKIVKDIEGNLYHTVQIGTQVWMVENLKTTKYRNGDPIPNVTDDIKWSERGHDTWPDSAGGGAYCNFENNSSKKSTYGRLYNWYAVNDKRKIAPPGWHIPTDAEWDILLEYISDENSKNGHLKEAGTVHWENPNTGATNETGFTALPGGYRNDNGTFSKIGLGFGGYWWCSTEGNTGSAWYRKMSYDNSYVSRNYDSKKAGFSVRCIRDWGVSNR